MASLCRTSLQSPSVDLHLLVRAYWRRVPFVVGLQRSRAADSCQCTDLAACCPTVPHSDGWKLLFPDPSSDLTQAHLFTGKSGRRW